MSRAIGRIAGLIDFPGSFGRGRIVAVAGVVETSRLQAPSEPPGPRVSDGSVAMGFDRLIMPQSSGSIALSTWWRCAGLSVRSTLRLARSCMRVHFGAEFHGLIAVVVQAGMPACIFKRREIRVGQPRPSRPRRYMRQTPALSGFSPSSCAEAEKGYVCQQECR